MAKKFYAQKDALGWPIPGTMMAAAKVPATAVEIPATTAPSGQDNPNGLRYFVRVDKKGNIIPNTLILSLKRPSGNVIEFKLPA